MATAEVEVKVDATGVLHEALKGFAEEFFKDYGVQLASVDFQWGMDRVEFVEVRSKTY